MKNVLTILFLSALIVSCNSSPSQEGSDNSDKKKNISSRNYGINKSNSYSDLFLDSLDMEKFIADKKVEDTLARRMRSFYNTRNYQFAWFSSDGLTEPGKRLLELL